MFIMILNIISSGIPSNSTYCTSKQRRRSWKEPIRSVSKMRYSLPLFRFRSSSEITRRTSTKWACWPSKYNPRYIFYFSKVTSCQSLRKSTLNWMEVRYKGKQRPRLQQSEIPTAPSSRLFHRIGSLSNKT